MLGVEISPGIHIVRVLVAADTGTLGIFGNAHWNVPPNEGPSWVLG